MTRSMPARDIASVLVPAQIQIVYYNVKIRLVPVSSLSCPYLGPDPVPSRSLFLISSSYQLRRSLAFKGGATVIV